MSQDLPTDPGPRSWLLPANPYSGRRIAIHLALFLATILTTLWVGAVYNGEYLDRIEHPTLLDLVRAGLPYSATLIAILLSHEMGHFIAGRIHRVRLSLPYFIPLPIALGTMGAIIAMPPLDSRRKLLDVGAAGPLAGLVVSTATMIVGLRLSQVSELQPGMTVLQEGQSLYYLLLKAIVLGPMPPGHDVFLHPIAWASWIGFLVTMLNLLPVGQLDGGHVAYALLGERQNRISGWMHLALVGLGIAVCAWFGGAAMLGGEDAAGIASAAQTGFSWFVWAIVLFIIRRLGKGYHPSTMDPAPLGPLRTAVGILCFILFFALFMPVPLRVVTL